MSLMCDDQSREIQFGEALWAATSRDTEDFSALCNEVVERVPPRLRRDTPCAPGDLGVNIHRGHSGPHRGLYPDIFTAYQAGQFKLGDFVFSISTLVAHEFLPNHMDRREARRLRTA